MKKILLVFLLLSSLCFAKVPKRAVSAAHFTTEILLSIGAEKQMVGTAYPDNPILPSLKEKYDKINKSISILSKYILERVIK